MSSNSLEFDILFKRIDSLVNELKNEGIDIKVKSDCESGSLKLYTSNSDILEIARESLKDVLELSYTTAEHHPYWNILYNSSEILNTILERWDTYIDDDQVNEMLWRNNEVRCNLTKLDPDKFKQSNF
ncbi:MAG: hypothetical protein MRJ93_08485 [Nitrososphaeraceae archaeon]|nr:hypothetical protein [Nitrososphaeraceae archaeon]